MGHVPFRRASGCHCQGDSRQEENWGQMQGAHGLDSCCRAARAPCAGSVVPRRIARVRNRRDVSAIMYPSAWLYLMFAIAHMITPAAPCYHSYPGSRAHLPWSCREAESSLVSARRLRCGQVLGGARVGACLRRGVPARRPPRGRLRAFCWDSLLEGACFGHAPSHAGRSCRRAGCWGACDNALRDRGCVRAAAMMPHLPRCGITERVPWCGHGRAAGRQSPLERAFGSASAEPVSWRFNATIAGTRPIHQPVSTGLPSWASAILRLSRGLKPWGRETR